MYCIATYQVRIRPYRLLKVHLKTVFISLLFFEPIPISILLNELFSSHHSKLFQPHLPLTNFPNTICMSQALSVKHEICVITVTPSSYFIAGNLFKFPDYGNISDLITLSHFFLSLLVNILYSYVSDSFYPSFSHFIIVLVLLN